MSWRCWTPEAWGRLHDADAGGALCASATEATANKTATAATKDETRIAHLSMVFEEQTSNSTSDAICNPRLRNLGILQWWRVAGITVPDSLS
jgi:hypothetical protein